MMISVFFFAQSHAAASLLLQCFRFYGDVYSVEDEGWTDGGDYMICATVSAESFLMNGLRCMQLSQQMSRHTIGRRKIATGYVIKMYP